MFRAEFIVILILGLLTGCGEQENEMNPNVSEHNIAQDTTQFKSIFNGDNLNGWDGDSRLWSVEKGVIVGETSEENNIDENTFLIWEEGKPANFELRFEYRFVRVGEEFSGNSGLQFRSERFKTDDKPDLEHRVRGYQVDFAVSDWIPGLHYEEKKRGILARRGQRVLIDSDGESHEERFAGEEELGKFIIHDEWNEYNVYANEDTIRAVINNKLMHEVIDQSPEARREGVLAFQLHVGPPMRVELRNIELNEFN